MKRYWWKEAVIYQIYPRSFNDSNGDGIGDLRGIIEKVDYLHDLGIDAVWINPVYQSPNEDNGYDISDYYQIMDEFGTMQDWQELIDCLHAKGIRLIMDMVVNHTSDEHSWFVESRSSKDSPYRDYYIWRPNKENNEPCNWLSYFGGSVWEHDQVTDEYYLHLFSKKQADLNWDNQKVRDNIYDMMKCWLDKGVDGLRMDVINLISKNREFPDVVTNKQYDWGMPHYVNGPKVHDYIREMNREVFSKYDMVTMGECPSTGIEEGIKYIDPARKELDMLINFELMDVDFGPQGRWDISDWNLVDFKKIVRKWQNSLDGRGWNALYLMSHDQTRTVSRFGDDEQYRRESAKMLLTLLLTLQGTPVIYQGDEIGMTNPNFESISEYKDKETIQVYEYEVSQGVDPKRMLQIVKYRSRDNSRTPMQWDSSSNAGFTEGTPWIKVNSNYTEINVENEIQDANSILNYLKKLLVIRKEEKTLVYGNYFEFFQEDPQLYCYLREYEGTKVVVVMNFSRDTASFVPISELRGKKCSVLMSNCINCSFISIENMNLLPYQVMVLKIL